MRLECSRPIYCLILIWTGTTGRIKGVRRVALRIHSWDACFANTGPVRHRHRHTLPIPLNNNIPGRSHDPEHMYQPPLVQNSVRMTSATNEHIPANRRSFIHFTQCSRRYFDTPHHDHNSDSLTPHHAGPIFPSTSSLLGKEHEVMTLTNRRSGLVYDPRRQDYQKNPNATGTELDF